MREELSPLTEFVAASKSQGASDESLVALLTRRGWPSDDVYAALGEYWATVTGLSVPGRVASGESSREAFLFLLAFSTLCCWTTALGSAIFSFINRWLPDPVVAQNGWSGWDRSSVTWQMSTLAVAFPIYLLVTRTIVKEAGTPIAPAQSGVRKWLTYLALLLTAGTVIGDLIWFLHSLLAGEITMRFVLKSLTVIVICGGIFGYYLPSLRRWRHPPVWMRQWHRAFAALSLAAVVAVFIVGLSLAGTPAVQRQYQADQGRVAALRHIANTIGLMNRRPGGPQLPASLAEMVAEAQLKDFEVRDAESGKPYDYRTLDKTRYELCAQFSYPSDDGPRRFDPAFWRHAAGRACFVLNTSNPSSYY